MNIMPRRLKYVMRAANVATVATTVITSVLGKKEAGSAAAPLNATSHILWGNEAASQDGVDAKHTAAGAAINAGAMYAWSFVLESRRRRRSQGRPRGGRWRYRFGARVRHRLLRGPEAAHARLREAPVAARPCDHLRCARRVAGRGRSLGIARRSVVTVDASPTALAATQLR